jgi:hypothetical protein
MKKILLLLSLIILVGCHPDEILIEPFPIDVVPNALVINSNIGIKLENTIVTDRVAMNVKLSSGGQYRIKIRHGINNELISQEMITATEGDNILRVYVASLDRSGYMIQLTDMYHNVLGNQSFVVN